MLNIQERRIQLRNIIRDSPSLKHTLSRHIDRAWEQARVKAEKETRIHQSTFAVRCPWSFEQVLDDAFWPESNTHSVSENTDLPSR